MDERLFFGILIYLAAISLLAVILTVSDKRRSIRGALRIPEKTLLLTALFGGSLAEWLTMKLIRHKTLHKKFMVGLPLMMLLQLAALLAICWKLGLFEFYF